MSSGSPYIDTLTPYIDTLTLLGSAFVLGWIVLGLFFVVSSLIGEVRDD